MAIRKEIDDDRDFVLAEWKKPYQTIDEIAAWHARLVDGKNKKYKSGCSREEAFIVTLCTGSVPNDSEADLDDLAAALRKWLAAWKKSRRWNDFGQSLWGSKAAKESAGIILQVVASVLRSQEHQALAQALAPTFRRRIARTDRGYFALVPDDSKIGDKIAIMKGGNLPLVLRRAGSRGMKLVGESYVHGIMHGEAWDDRKCERIRLV